MRASSTAQRIRAGLRVDGAAALEHLSGVGLFEGQVDAYTHTSTSYEPGCHGWEWSRHFKGLIKRGMITQREYDTFIDGLEQQAEQNRFLYAITIFSYVGVKVA